MDDLGICNMALGKLGSYSIASLSPANTPLEKKMALRYPQWRDSELTRRRWVFARWYATLTEGGGPVETAERPYSFAVPADCMRVIREKGAKWEQRGRYIYSANATQSIEYIKRVVATDFDPLFNDTLIARIVYEMCEDVTQSNVKKAAAERDYDKTIHIASAANALVLGSDDSIVEEDDDDEWMLGRRGHGV